MRFLDLLYIVALALYILAGTSIVPFHGDESTQVYMSRDYAYQFMERDLSRVRYSDPPLSAQEQDLRLLNGTVNKYLIGLAWHLGGYTLADINEQWDWGADWNYNQTTGHAPAPELLVVARLPSALLLAGGAALMFALGWALGGRPVAYLASAYYALNPALLLNGRRAMMEGSLVFFALAVVVAAIWVLRNKASQWDARDRADVPAGRPDNAFFFLSTLFLGIWAGLALASKHTAIFTVAAVFAACVVYRSVSYISRRREGAKARSEGLAPILRLCVSAVIALLVFLALNPAWWDDPAARLVQVLERRQALLDGQTATFGGYALPSDTLGGFARQTFVALPQYYELPVWETYIGDQIAAYDASVWHGVAIGGSTLGGIVVFVCTVIGVGTLFRGRGSPSTRWIIGVWTLVVTFTTLLLTPLEWARYYLLMVPVIGLLSAAGVVTLFRAVMRTRGKM